MVMGPTPVVINGNPQEHNRNLLRLSVGSAKSTESPFLFQLQRCISPHTLKSLLNFLNKNEVPLNQHIRPSFFPPLC